MYRLTKRIEVAGAHMLELDYDSPCRNLHGHNWIVNVTIEGPDTNHNGMLLDFKHIKNVVMQLDHAYINDVVQINPINPTAENIAQWIAESIQDAIYDSFDWSENGLVAPKVCEVSVQESEGNTACYIP